MSEESVEALVAAIVGCGLVLFQAWVFEVMWRWFVVPVGANPVGYWQAMGISTLIDLATFRAGMNREGTPLSRLGEATGITVVSLVIGFLIHRLA